MPKILAISEEMTSRAKSILGKVQSLGSSQTDLAKTAENMTPYFSGALPELMTRKMSDMKTKHEAIREKITDYAEKIEFAANSYNWTDREIAQWASELSGSQTQTPSTPISWPSASSDISEPVLTGAAYKEYRGEGDPDFYHQCVGYAKGRLAEKLGITTGGSWGSGGGAAARLWFDNKDKTLDGTNGSYSVQYYPYIADGSAEDTIPGNMLSADNFRGPAIASFAATATNPDGHVVFIEDTWEDEDGKKWVKYSDANVAGADGIKPAVTLQDFTSMHSGLTGLLYFEKL